LKIILRENRLVISGNATMDGGTPLGGSATPLLAMIKNYVDWGFGLVTPLKMSTWVPARIIGEAKKGMLRVGNDADLILLDDQVNLIATIIKGAVAYATKQAPV
jgi:N-acetylglucosamine-6-phosphate deacetylase